MAAKNTCMHLLEQDIVEARWGMRFYGYYSTGSEEFVMKDGSAFVPRTRAVLFGSERALVLAFRGSEPTNLINLRSAGRHACCGVALLVWGSHSAVS